MLTEIETASGHRAPRSDIVGVIATISPVIASEAKQSRLFPMLTEIETASGH